MVYKRKENCVFLAGLKTMPENIKSMFTAQNRNKDTDNLCKDAFKA